MYKLLKSTEPIAGNLQYRLHATDRALENLAVQLNAKDSGIEEVITVDIHVTEHDVHVVALVKSKK